MAWRTAVQDNFSGIGIMNQKAQKFIKNVLYAAGANVSRIVTTMILTLLLPRLLSVEDYSYWQLYLFYGTYFIYSSVGWCEGTYLKYGGCEYEKLDGRQLSSQFFSMSIYEGIVAGIAICLSCYFIHDTLRRFIMISAAAYMWLYILKYQLQTVLQAVNRISDYARVYSGERFLYFSLVILGLLAGQRSFQTIIFAEISSNVLALGYGIYLCREVTLCKPLRPVDSLKETTELIRIGYKLTVAGFASQIIIGIVRFAIERNWGTVVFGKISLSFSMANMLITCITAVSIVLFPMLKRSDPQKINQCYPIMRAALTYPLFAILIAYVPMKAILVWWLPQYSDSLKYLAILFPLCIYEVRNSVLVWTYLKVLRKEAVIMRANLLMIAVSLGMTFFSVLVWNNLDLAVGSIVVIYGLKAAYTEWSLGKYIPVFSGKDWFMETCLSVIFILGSWCLDSMRALMVYLAAYSCYIVLKRKEIVCMIGEIKYLLLTEKG